MKKVCKMNMNADGCSMFKQTVDLSSQNVAVSFCICFQQVGRMYVYEIDYSDEVVFVSVHTRNEPSQFQNIHGGRCFYVENIVGTACIACGAGLWNGTVSVRLSVCPSIDPQQQTRCCRFAAVGPAGRSYRSIAAAGRLKTQVRKTKVPEDGICKYRIRKYEHARVENASTENESTNLQRWKT